MEISWGCHGTFMEYKMGCKMRCKMGCTIWVKWCKIGTFQFPACKRLPEGSYFFHFFPVLRWGITSPKPTSDLLQQSHTILPWCQVDALWNVRDIRAPWHGWPATSCWITILIAACHLLPYFEKKHKQSSPICFCCQCLSIALSNWLMKYTDHTSNSSGYLWFVISYPNWVQKKIPSWTRARLVTHSPHVTEQCCWDEQLRFSMPNVGPPVMWTLVYNPQ